MGRIAMSPTRDGEGMHALMDGRSRRSGAFLIAQRETGEVVETIDNASASAFHGARTGAADALQSAGLNAVISGRFGPKACDALRALGIEAWVAPPGITAEEALSMFRNGDLERMESQANRPSSRSAAELLVVAPQTTAAESMEDPYQYYGIGWGYWPWPEGGGRRRFRRRGPDRSRAS